jgi:hypothetical protein
MRVYVESNFVLEVVLKQEQHVACEDLVGLAKTSSIELVLPSFSLLEPHQTIVRREKDWKALRSSLLEQAKQLDRTAWIASEVPQLRQAVELLLRADQEAARRFSEVRASLLDVARMISIGTEVLQRASMLVAELDLELPDAVMLAAVLGDAASQPAPSVFLNRNTRDFDDPDIKKRLQDVNCTIVWTFHDGLARVKSALGRDNAHPG